MREAWDTIHRWYRKDKENPPHPTGEGLEKTSDIREELYRWRPPEGAPIRILVQSVDIPE